jgi:hypothetical protein
MPRHRSITRKKQTAPAAERQEEPNGWNGLLHLDMIRIH